MGIQEGLSEEVRVEISFELVGRGGKKKRRVASQLEGQRDIPREKSRCEGEGSAQERRSGTKE